MGEVLGHDLMSPHTILSDSATVATVEAHHPDNANTHGPSPQPTFMSPEANTFLPYATKLLEQATRSENAGLLSPTDDEAGDHTYGSEQVPSMKEVIDSAILKGHTGSSKRSVTRFEINRSGEKVAVIILSRPAYRLGESIPVVIDFQQADVVCYSVHAMLESSESVDPTIALRSKASIQRVTRRIHTSHLESTMSSERVFFSLRVPAAATPEFLTSGVSLEWNLRLQFVTSRPFMAEEYEEGLYDLMEEIAKDERGTVKAAVQALPCETFDVTVPLRIYGATAVVDENSESGSLS